MLTSSPQASPTFISAWFAILGTSRSTWEPQPSSMVLGPGCGSGTWMAYAASKCRIVTAALNPSGRDFRDPNDDDYAATRFIADSCASSPDNFNLYKRFCADFFRVGRRDSWFGNFRKILRGIEGGADYSCSGSWNNDLNQTTFENQAIHLDIFSPFATQQKWSDLDGRTKDRLRAQGEPMFKEMLRILKPHVALIGVSLSSAPGWLVEEHDLSWFGPEERQLSLAQARSAAISVKIVSGSLAVVGGAAIVPYGARGWKEAPRDRRRELATWLSSQLALDSPVSHEDDAADLGHRGLPWLSLDYFFCEETEFDPFCDDVVRDA